jgi:hypothetical protein
MRCCCGEKDIDEPILINDYRHEPLDWDDSFCGPSYKHEIRDLNKEICRLRKIAARAIQKATHDFPHFPETCEACLLESQLKGINKYES